MLVHPEFMGFIPVPHPVSPSLKGVRAHAKKELEAIPCMATRHRLLLAVNEIVANILRHAAPRAQTIVIECVSCEGERYVVIRDDGGAFDGFYRYWRHASLDASDVNPSDIKESSRGLAMIKLLCPAATYIPRGDGDPHNQFILPVASYDGVIPFFRP